MSFEQEKTAAESLVPPRPNLGPEPWPEPSGWPGTRGWAGLVVALIVAAVAWRAVRRRTAGAAVAVEAGPPPDDRDQSPGRRLIAASEVVRTALIEAFGPAWGSRTTEEVADDPTLAGRLDPAEVDRLVGLLREADRVKFGSAEPDAADDWEVWASGLASALAAGATSRRIGP